MTRAEKALFTGGFWAGVLVGWWVGFGQGFDQGQFVGANRVMQGLMGGVRTAVGS